MTFASPYLLLLLAIVPLLALAPRWIGQMSRPAGLRYAGVGLGSNPSGSWRTKLSPALTAMRLAALALVIVAAARPQSSEAYTVIRGEGVDIALALDISGTMGNLDMVFQSRLDAAKVVVGDFISQREHDRIGLVVFARESFIQSPPTTDHDLLRLMLDDLDLAPNLPVEDGTAIGLGLASAGNMLKDSPNESRVIILLTDGLNNSGQIDPLTAAAAIKALGIRAYTVGIGSPEAFASQMIPFSAADFTRQNMALGEETLRAVAETTGARYFHATDAEGLRLVYDEINDLEKSEIEERVFTRHEELMAWALAPALVILLAELALRSTVFRKVP